MTGDNEGETVSSNVAFFDLSSFALLSTFHLPQSITTLQISQIPASSTQTTNAESLVVVLAFETIYVNNEKQEVGLLLIYDWIRGLTFLSNLVQNSFIPIMHSQTHSSLIFMIPPQCLGS
jgi:hypothetical protein